MQQLYDILRVLAEHGYVADGDIFAQHDVLYFSGPELSEQELDQLVDTETYDGDDECVKELIRLGAHWDIDGDSWAVFT